MITKLRTSFGCERSCRSQELAKEYLRLHLHAHPQYERWDFQAPLVRAVECYCQAAGIFKNVTVAASRSMFSPVRKRTEREISTDRMSNG